MNASVYKYTCIRLYMKSRFEIRTTQGVSLLRLTSLEWGKSTRSHQARTMSFRTTTVGGRSLVYVSRFLLILFLSNNFFFCLAVRRNLYVKNLIFLPCRTACKMKNIFYRCSKQKMIWCNIGTYIQRSVTWKISGLLSIK